LLLNLKLSQFQLRSYAYGLATSTDADWFIIQGVGAGSTSFLSNATDFGAAMCVVAPFAFYLTKLANPRWLRAVGLVSTAMFVLSIVRTGSRGAALGLIAMAAVFWFKSRQKLTVAFAVVGLLIGVWIITPQASKERFISATNYQQDRTASSRLDFWKAGIGMFLSHPITGVGIYNFRFAYVAGGGDVAIVPHSIFIQAASELGVPGISILFALLILMFRRNWETRRLATGDSHDARFLRGFADALDISLVGFIVSGTFLTILYYPHIFVLLAMTISLNQIARRQAAAADIGRAGVSAEN
jgi:probable O-glycosylation ligase (exosortase A-associated)